MPVFQRISDMRGGCLAANPPEACYNLRLHLLLYTLVKSLADAMIIETWNDRIIYRIIW